MWNRFLTHQGPKRGWPWARVAERAVLRSGWVAWGQTAYFTARRREEKFDDGEDTQHTDLESLESKKKNAVVVFFSLHMYLVVKDHITNWLKNQKLIWKWLIIICLIVTSGLSWFLTLQINRLLSDLWMTGRLTLVTFRKAPCRVKWVVMLIKSAFWVIGLEMQGLQVMWRNPLVNREEPGAQRTSEASPGPARVPASLPAVYSWCPCCHWGARPGLHSGYDLQLECCVVFFLPNH